MGATGNDGTKLMGDLIPTQARASRAKPQPKSKPAAKASPAKKGAKPKAAAKKATRRRALDSRRASLSWTMTRITKTTAARPRPTTAIGRDAVTIRATRASPATMARASDSRRSRSSRSRSSARRASTRIS